MASIRKRGNSYQITVSCGYDIKGKKIFETTTFNPDPSLTPRKQEKAAIAFAQDFENKIKNGYAMDGRKITFQEFSERWLQEYAKSQLLPFISFHALQESDRKAADALESILKKHE